MNRFLVTLLFLMINLNCFAQSKSEQVLFSLSEEQAKGLVAAVERYKNNYSSDVYGLVAIDRGSNFVFQFQKAPLKKKGQKGGGSMVVQITYSKELSKVVEVTEVRSR
jgi:hypothetical protein